MLFILTLTALIGLFCMWLTFALLTARHDPEKTATIIRAAGEWFPFRRCRDTRRLPGRHGKR